MAGVITGIGGVFFKAKDPEKLSAWYQEHLGMPFEASMGCAMIQWQQDSRVDEGGQTVWMVAKQESDWFAPSSASFMINYRVDDMNALMAKLDAAGIPLQKGPEEHPHGIFVWVMDPEGNKVELWEPKA